MKKTSIIILCVCLALTVLILGIIGITRTTTDLEAYQSHGGYIVYELPETAQNCRFAAHKSLICKQYLYAFTLSDSDADTFITKLIREYKLDSADENDRKYGYAHWFGKTVSECTETESELDNFPIHMPFLRVTDRDIASAELLVYSPYGTGSRCSGIMRFPDSGEFVCWYAVSI